MKTSPAGIDLIKRWEGYSATVYSCAGGWPTIGYGHVVLKGENFDDGVDESTAVNLLKKDVGKSEYAVGRLIAVDLDQFQFDALVSFTFNLGAGALQRSTLRRKLNRGEYALVPRELMKWVYAGGRKLRGLVRRRRDEAELFCGGL